MDDDKLLRTLGGVASEEERDPARTKLERLNAGDLPADEVAELERQAETDEETAMLLSAYRPLDAGARERIAADLAAHVPHGAAANVHSISRAAQRPAKGQWRARAYAGAATLALAAGIAFVITRAPASAALPPYALEVTEAASLRGPSSANGAAVPADPAARTRGCNLRASARGSFEVLARTDQPGAGDITAAAFVVHGGSVDPWTGALEVSPAGSVRIADSAGLLRGASELRLVVGRKAQLAPADARAKAVGAAAAGPGWQVLRCAVTQGVE